MNVLSRIAQNVPRMWKSSSTSKQNEQEEQEEQEEEEEPQFFTPKSSISEAENPFFTPPSKSGEHATKFGQNEQLYYEEEEMGYYSSTDDPIAVAVERRRMLENTDVKLQKQGRRKQGRFHHGRFYLDNMLEGDFGELATGSSNPDSPESEGHAYAANYDPTLHLPAEYVVDEDDLPPEYQDFLKELSQLQSQEVVPNSRDILALDRQTQYFQPTEQHTMASSNENHAQASFETEKFPDWVHDDDDVYPFDFSVTTDDMSRSRANTYQPVFMPRNLKSRSMSHAEMAAEVLSDEAVNDVHTSLTTLPSPPSLVQARTRRATIKVNRRALINDIIRPRTKIRAQAIFDRPRESFTSEGEYKQLTETAEDVLVQIAKLDERARARDEELDREQRKREHHQTFRAAELQQLTTSLSRMKRQQENGEQVRDVTWGRCEEEEDSEIAGTLSTFEGGPGGFQGFERY